MFLIFGRVMMSSTSTLSSYLVVLILDSKLSTNYGIVYFSFYLAVELSNKSRVTKVKGLVLSLIQEGETTILLR